MSLNTNHEMTYFTSEKRFINHCMYNNTCVHLLAKPKKILSVASFIPCFALMVFSNLLFFPNTNPVHISTIIISLVKVILKNIETNIKIFNKC